MNAPQTEKKQIKIILCADDFAIAPGVSSAIISLIKAGRITATSCMSISLFWHEYALSLSHLREMADIGLHFTLTGFKPLGSMPCLASNGYLPSYKDLLSRSLTGRLDLDEIKREMIRQLDSFEKEWGSPPDFLDGHLFVHHLPGIRAVLIDLYKSRLQGSGAYVRVASTPISVIFRRRVNILKTLSIGYFGWRLEKMVKGYGIPFNAGFSGIYDFSDLVPYRVLFERFLIRVENCCQIMCHPGIVDDELSKVDNLTKRREVEYEFFRGDGFPEILNRAGVCLGRFY